MQIENGFPIYDLKVNGELTQRLPKKLSRQQSQKTDSFLKDSLVFPVVSYELIDQSHHADEEISVANETQRIH